MDHRSVLIFAPTPHGGIAEHTHYQARELASRGYATLVLCQPGFAKDARSAGYGQSRSLLQGGLGASLAMKVQRAMTEIANHFLLAGQIVRRRPAFVLLEANTEYGAWAWAWPHWLLRWMGAIYLANFHDPVRTVHIGPAWWHRLSVILSLKPLSGGLIHGPVPPEARIPARLIMREAPFGPFEDLAGSAPAFDARARLGIGPDAFVLLAFGHIADRKNLDLAIAALVAVPGAHLVIAGSVGSARDRPAAFYEVHAERLGVADRVHLVSGFIAEADIAAYFAAADAVALTYARGFVSQSGVLQIAALWDKPLLASGGAGPLPDTVLRYGLGLVVEPDSAPAIAEGLARLIAERPDLGDNFGRYRASTSWAVNVDRMLEVVAAVRGVRS